LLSLIDRADLYPDILLPDSDWELAWFIEKAFCSEKFLGDLRLFFFSLTFLIMHFYKLYNQDSFARLLQVPTRLLAFDHDYGNQSQ